MLRLLNRSGATGRGRLAVQVVPPVRVPVVVRSFPALVIVSRMLAAKSAKKLFHRKDSSSAFGV